MRMAKNSIFIQSRSSSPRRRELCLTRGASPRLRTARLGEPEALKFLVSSSPQQGCLRLGEPEVLFLFLSSVNSRNHQLE